MSPATEAVVAMIAPADVQAIAESAKRDALAFLENNKVLVTDLASCQRAVTLRKEIQLKQKDVVLKLAKPKSWANSLHKWFCDLENAALEPYALLDTYEQAEIKAWNDAQAEIARAEERRLAELRRKEEQDRAIAEAAALEEAALSAPSRQEADEMLVQAEAVVREAIAAPRPVVSVPSLSRSVVGLKTRRDWRWRFVGGPSPSKAADILKDTPPEVVARATAKMPREYLMVDVKKIDGIVSTMQTTTAIPGVEVYYVDVPVR